MDSTESALSVLMRRPEEIRRREGDDRSVSVRSTPSVPTDPMVRLDEPYLLRMPRRLGVRPVVASFSVSASIPRKVTLACPNARLLLLPKRFRRDDACFPIPIPIPAKRLPRRETTSPLPSVAAIESASAVLGEVDGARTVGAIVAELQSRFPDAEGIEEDIVAFLEVAVERFWIELR